MDQQRLSLDGQELSVLLLSIYSFATEGDWDSCVGIINKSLNTIYISFSSSKMSAYIQQTNESIGTAATEVAELNLIPFETPSSDLPFEITINSDANLVTNAEHNRDIQLLNLLLPHIDRALRLFTTQYIAKRNAAMHKELINSTGIGAVICDEFANIIVSNKHIETVFAQVDEIHEMAGTLRCKDKQLDSKLLTSIHKVANSEKRSRGYYERVYVKRAQSEHDVLIEIHHLPNVKESNQALTKQCIVLTKYQQSLPWAQIKSEYSLTSKECELLKLLYAKHSVESASVKLGINTQTSRNHLLKVFKKLNVNSQAALMRKMSIHL